MKASKKAKRAILSILHDAACCDGSLEPIEDERLMRCVRGHPLYSDLDRKALGQLVDEAVEDLKGEPAESLKRWASHVPPELAETTVELATRVLLSNRDFNEWERTWLSALDDALGLTDAQFAAATKRAIAHHKKLSRPAMDGSHEAKLAILCLALAALKADGRQAEEELDRLIAEVAEHPLYAKMTPEELTAIGEEATLEASRVAMGEAIATFAPKAPPDLAETALELTLRAIFTDGVLEMKGEGAFLDALGSALGFSTEEGQAICKRIMDEQKALRGGYSVAD